MNRRDDNSGPTGVPGTQGGGEQGGVVTQPAPPRVEKKRRKVSLIAAIIINVVTVLTVAIVLLAILLPGYRRSFTMAKAVKGSDEVWVVVRTSESVMRENSTDFIRAQDSLRNAMQELVESGGENTWAYVRDNFPDQAWIEQNLPDDMRQWLEKLYPKPQESQGGQEATPTEGGGNASSGQTPAIRAGQ